MNNEEIQKKYSDVLLIVTGYDGPPLSLYADDLLDPEALESALWTDFEQNGWCLTREGVYFIDEIYGEDFLQSFYERRGYTHEDAKRTVRNLRSDDPRKMIGPLRNSRMQKKIRDDILGLVGDSPLGFYQKTPDCLFTANDFFQYPIFKPFLKAYFLGEATLTKEGYIFFEKYNFPEYLSTYYWLVLHNDLKRFHDRKEAENWVAEQKEHAQSKGG